MQTIEKVETVVRLPKDLIDQARNLNNDAEISDVIENALRTLVYNAARTERDRRELEILNANADRLNEEAIDVLEYQLVKRGASLQSV